jgi:putative endonuclease
MPTKRKSIGIDGESRVASYLTDRGFTILARNYAKQYGEIDIIASKGDVVAFVEVKTRSYHYLNPEEIITPSKQKKIIMTAQSFIACQNYDDKTYRFDVAFVTVIDKTMSIEYIDNAFN